MDTVPSQQLFTDYLKDDLDHHGIIGAVDNADFMSSLMAALSSGQGCGTDD